MVGLSILGPTQSCSQPNIISNQHQLSQDQALQSPSAAMLSHDQKYIINDQSNGLFDQNGYSMSPAAAGAHHKQPRNKNTIAAAKFASATKSKGGATKHAALLYTLMTQRDSETIRSKL